MRVRHQNIAQTGFQIGQIARQAEHGHHFAGHGNVETVGANHAVGRFSQAVNHVAQLAVVHIDNAPPQDAFRVDIQCVALINVVVQQGGQQVVCRADGMEIAREVQVDVFHRQHLRITAARRAAFNAEHGAQRRFAHGDHGFFADVVQCVGQTDGDGGFSFAGGRGVDGGDQHQPPLFFGQFECVGRIDFGFVFAVMLQLVGLQAQFFGNLVDVPDIGGLCDFYVRFHVAAPLKIHHADKNVGHCSVFPCVKAACTPR